MTTPSVNDTKKKTVKAWAIVNTEEDSIIWGIGGVAAHPIQVFSMESRAKFVMNLPEHAEEVALGQTDIIPVEITYSI